MRAVFCDAFGPVETLTVREAPDPVPAPGEVLIDVRASGVNFPDGLMVQGKYQVKPPFPFIPGAECAGVVSAVGGGVTGFAAGDRVLATNGTGGYATMAAMPEAKVVKIPDAMGFEVAAGLTITYATTIHALVDVAVLRPGQTLLVLGAAGGVGLAACEIGALIGARVIAAASSEEKLALAQAHGAHEGIDYTATDLRTELKRLAPAGVDVCYDPVGGAATEAAVRGLGWRGTLLVVGFAAGEIPKLPLNLLLLREAQAKGVFWGAFAEREPLAQAQNMAELFRWFRAGKIRPHVSATYPLEGAREALETVMGRRVLAKWWWCHEAGSALTCFLRAVRGETPSSAACS